MRRSRHRVRSSRHKMTWAVGNRTQRLGQKGPMGSQRWKDQRGQKGFARCCSKSQGFQQSWGRRSNQSKDPAQRDLEGQEERLRCLGQQLGNCPIRSLTAAAALRGGFRSSTQC